MPHGTPDWGLVGPISILYGLDDLAEHAVRVGAVPSWDRIGHVIFSDDFSEGLGAWHFTRSSADAIICLYTPDAMSPPFCVKMVNGSGGTFTARISHHLGYDYRGRTGLEFNIAFGTDIEYIKFGLFRSIAAGREHYYVRLTPTTGEFAHGEDTVGWTPFETIGDIQGSITQWHDVKLVVDFDTGFFVKLAWEGRTIDMSTIAAIPLAAAKPYHWLALIEVDSSDSDQYEMRVDNVITTIDEP